MNNNAPLESLAAFAIAFAAGALSVVALRTYVNWITRPGHHTPVG